MMHIITVPSSKDRQEYITNLMGSLKIEDWTFVYGKESPKRFDALYDTIKGIVKQNYDKPYTIILEDDVFFTEHFSLEKFKRQIQEANSRHADILLGGIKEHCFQISKEGSFLRIHNYRGSQLMVVYKKFYDTLLNRPSGYGEFELFSSFNGNIIKFVTFPFIAYQEDFPSRFLEKNIHKIDYSSCEAELLKRFK